MMRNQTEKFQNWAAQFFLGSMALAFVTLAIGRQPSHHLKRDEQGE
jgi:hypothetical protein